MYQVNLLPWRLRRQRQRYTFWLRCFVAQLLLVLATLTTAYFFAVLPTGQATVDIAGLNAATH
ncbi:TPA: hypothetical protein ACSP7Z_000054 [Serratia fonticola]